ncbi:hypothetical protein BY458DRAFT_551810 [Sporodiniella umbellata]|nr:hypothetical protein BY458DRAFT_551810 [Sporodiniella umbellata]
MQLLPWVRWISKRRSLYTASWLPWEDKILKDYVEHNGRQWTKVVQHCLPHRSPKQCEGRWVENLRPNLKKGPFSKDEREILKNAVKEFGVGKWKEICLYRLPERSHRRIANEWNSNRPTVGGWTEEEERLLIKGVEKHGLHNWINIVREFLPHRSRSSVRNHYREFLTPNLSLLPWNENELDLLLRRTIIFGLDWNKVAEGIPNRAPEQCRYQWIKGIDPSLSKEPWTPNEERLFLERLIEAKGHLKTASDKMPGRNSLFCFSKFREILLDPELNIAMGDSLKCASHENRLEWRARVARLICEWLDKSLSFRVLAHDGLLVFKQGRWSEEERAELDAACKEQQTPDWDTITQHTVRSEDKEQAELDTTCKEQQALDWNTIAKRVGRTPNQCRRQYEEQMFSVGTKRTLWSPEEDDLLLKAIETHGKDWVSVAALVPERSPTQCSYRWRRVLRYPNRNDQPLSDSEKTLLWEGYQMFGPNWQVIQKSYFPDRRPDHLMRWWSLHKPKENYDFRKPGWTEVEEDTLKFAIERSTSEGKINWPLVSKMMENRTAKECRLQWQIKLDPTLKKGKWDSEEKMRMVELVQKYKIQESTGSFWPLVAQELGTGRSVHSCRSAYYKMQRKGSRYAT